MTRLEPAVAVDPRLARTLWQWLALGALALCLWPELRGSTETLGWGPYWAVVAPVLALGVAYRHRFLGSREDAPATAHRRRSRVGRGQAQRAAVPRRDRRLRVA